MGLFNLFSKKEKEKEAKQQKSETAPPKETSQSKPFTKYEALNLGKCSFNDEDCQKIKDVAIRYLPDDLSNPSTQLELLEMLSNVMDISAPKMETEHDWKSIERIPDTTEEKEERFKNALAETILAVDHTFGCLKPQFLIEKVHDAKAEELLKGWIVCFRTLPRSEV